MQEYTQRDFSLAQPALVLSPTKVSLSTKSFETYASTFMKVPASTFRIIKIFVGKQITKRITHLNIESFDKYLDYVKFNPSGSAEVKYLYEAITINETFFFRNQPQLDALVTTILPEIISSKEKLGKIKLKSGVLHHQAERKHTP